MIPAMSIRFMPLIASLVGLASVSLQRPGRRSMAANGRAPDVASGQRQRAAAAVGVGSWRDAQLGGETRRSRDPEVLGADAGRLVGGPHRRLRQRLVRELGRRSVGDAARRWDARGPLAPEERSGHVRVRRAPLLLQGRGQDVVAVVHAPQRRHHDRARFRVPVPDARCRSRSRVARWPGDEARCRARRTRRRGRGDEPAIRASTRATGNSQPKVRSTCVCASAVRRARR